jgi:flagellar protein FlgJ
MDRIDLATPRDYQEQAEVNRRLQALQSASVRSTGRSRIDRESRLYQASQEFEAIFIKQMLKVMRDTVPEDDILDGGMAEDIFEDMLYDQYALKMAKTAGFGLADQIYLQLVRDGDEV